MTDMKLPSSSVAAFTEALHGEQGALAAWLEANDEREVVAHIEAYARANVAVATTALRAEIDRLRAERDALARENEAMKRCATKYLEWLGVTHMPLDQALHDDMHNPKMCGDAALHQDSRP